MKKVTVLTSSNHRGVEMAIKPNSTHVVKQKWAVKPQVVKCFSFKVY